MRFLQGIGVVLAGLSIACAAARGDDATSPLVLEIKAPHVEVVGSTADLKKQPGLMANGVPVKLGIESVKVPANGGVLAYCLWTPEEGRNYVFTGPRQAAMLGPLSVRIQKQGPEPVAAVQQIRTSATYVIVGEQVSVASLSVQEPGKYEVEFYAMDGTVVAATQIEAVENKMPQWYGLTLTAEKRTAQPPELAATVKLGQYAVNPRWPPQASAKAEGALQTFLPAQADPDFKAAWVAGTLTLTTKGPLVMQSAGSNLLLRWWLNGKPVSLPEQGTRTLASPAPTTMEGNVKIELTFDGAFPAIGDKPGDKVEVEVLYSAYGWEYTGLLTTARLARTVPAHVADGTPLRLSNKAEFVVPEK